LGPNPFDANGLHFERERRLLGRREHLLQPRAKSAKTFHPTGRKPAIRLTLPHRTVLEKFADVSPESVSIFRRHERGLYIATNFYWPLKKKLFQVRPEVIRHQYRRPTEPGHW